MKTTIEIHTPLFREAKKHAQIHHKSLREIVETALQLYLEKKKEVRKPFRLKKHPFKGDGLVEGLEDNWAAIRSRVYEGRGG